MQNRKPEDKLMFTKSEFLNAMEKHLKVLENISEKHINNNDDILIKTTCVFSKYNNTLIVCVLGLIVTICIFIVSYFFAPYEVNSYNNNTNTQVSGESNSIYEEESSGISEN